MATPATPTPDGSNGTANALPPAMLTDLTQTAAPTAASPQPTAAPATAPDPAFEPADKPLLAEITTFHQDCRRRYAFNNRWDVVLTVVGILLSVAVVAAGFSRMPMISALLGALVGAIVTAQKAFPFGQRAGFYRLLIGNAENLLTRATQGMWGKTDAVNPLASRRLDFAQQLPRGVSGAAPDPAQTGPLPASTQSAPQ